MTHSITDIDKSASMRLGGRSYHIYELCRDDLLNAAPADHEFVCSELLAMIE